MTRADLKHCGKIGREQHHVSTCCVLLGLNRRLVLDWEKGAAPVCPFGILVKIAVCREHEIDKIF